MSVIRPRPPTDPVAHVVQGPGLGTGDGPARARRLEWLARADAVRGDVAMTPAAGAATALLAAYGTLGAPARRSESDLFALLARARRVREAVDLVVVVGDRADRAVVDLLMATCCHPFHDLLPRHERGGRPRIVTLGPGDDDDRIQGVIDLVGIPRGDRLSDAWLPLVAGPCAEPASRGIRALLEETWRKGAAARDMAGDRGAEIGAPAGRESSPGGREAPWSALLAAAVVGVDVVRLLEGAAAMERRFREAAPEANPVLTAAILGPCLADTSPGVGAAAPRRRLLAPAHWHALGDWHDALAGDDGEGAGGKRFVTPIVVAACRRAPFGEPRPADVLSASVVASAADRIDLPRADEHTIGQLLAFLLLEHEVARRLG